MGNSLGTKDPVHGIVLHGPVSREPVPSAYSSSPPLLLTLFPQICHGAPGSDGACAWTGASPHSQTQEGLSRMTFNLCMESKTATKDTVGTITGPSHKS